jgi:hypothetical protein
MQEIGNPITQWKYVQACPRVGVGVVVRRKLSVLAGNARIFAIIHPEPCHFTD